MSNHTLWYNTPAKEWGEGLPIGNGRLGAVVLSDLHRETWSLNEITFWSGQSEPPPKVYGGKDALKQLRERYFQNDYAGGQKLAEKCLQPEKQNFGTNLSVGNVTIDVESAQEAVGFKRWLDLDEAVACTEYKDGGSTYLRETFVSHPAQVLVSRFSTDASEGISLSISMSSDVENLEIQGTSDAVQFNIQALESVHSNGRCGVKGKGTIKVVAEGGSVHFSNDKIQVQRSAKVTIFIAFNTDFRKNNDHWKTLGSSQLHTALALDYEKLKKQHLEDHQQLYRRVSFDLEKSQNSDLPTDRRHQGLSKNNFDDPDLFGLYFQYSRYLTIAGNRATSPLPLHLQGLWNDGEANRMNWSCDYHLDINTQMNYFPTYVSNLLDCTTPLNDYITALSNAGSTTANDFYGCDGWVAHVFSNIWGFTEPGWETSWGLNVTGGLWLAMQLIEYYEYTLDESFLARTAYPVLKKAAEFFLDYMVMDPRTEYLVTGPSVSPENSFFPKDASQGEHQLSLGCTIDIVLVRDLFKFCIYAARKLKIDPELILRLRVSAGHLPPLQIGARGNLQEWLEDYAEAQPDHRHLSHTIALCRSSQISTRETPELAAAVRKTLELRSARAGLEDIEFTAALFGLNYARLGDGESALRVVGHLIGELCFDNLLSFSKAGIAGAEKNIFVVDGNFGGAAVVGEMLLRSSRLGEMELLPALPKGWRKGGVKGLRARGNVTVDIDWAEGVLTGVTIRAGSTGKMKVWYQERSVDLSLAEGQLIRLNGQLAKEKD